ncbi:FAD-dependent oxidoreductase [Mesorhizobium sp. L-8-10]|uniref:FAD-dependent oxidoreductase n=1 Tax=Mesorhizobium sp. L-8-10 TaxID=2744523 RepID=UPI001925BB34|nr:FAD-dependent oxidoreductase [Mesorhizobium sp. L-8-10]
MQDAAVLIVGGGPCGLMLANELGRRGVPAILVDDKPGTTTKPQANATQARTMEHYRRLGFAEEVRALGLPADYPTDMAYFTRFTRHELARYELPSARDARVIIKSLTGDWSAAELPHRCSQLYIEPILKEHASRLPSISLRYGWQLTGFEDDGDGVEATIARTDDGAIERLRVGWLIGCDGPRSFVRKTLGYNFLGEGGAQRDFMGGRMQMLHFRAPHLYDIIPHRKAWMYWAFNNERRCFMCALDGIRDFVFHTQLRPGEREEDVTDESMHAMLEQVVGLRFPIEVLGRAAWTAGFALVAERFQRGRVLLAGDAAHLFTPSGGLGYNTGIEDAVNLGWKLAAVAKGWAEPALMDSYEAERRPVALRNTAFARGFAARIGVPPDPAIEDATPVGTEARQRAGNYLNAAIRAEFNIPGITFGARYDDSPVIVPDGTAPPPDSANNYTPTACPGGRTPHRWLPDGRSLFDLFGFEFTIMCSRPELGQELADTAARLGIPATVLDMPDEETRALYEACLVLIRPDQIVAWRGKAPPRDAAALWRTVTGAKGAMQPAAAAGG